MHWKKKKKLYLLYLGVKKVGGKLGSVIHFRTFDRRTGAGAEARNAIGWVVFGGLGIAVVFTLYLTPVLYLALARFTKPRADETDRLEREMEAAGEHV